MKRWSCFTLVWPLIRRDPQSDAACCTDAKKYLIHSLSRSMVSIFKFGRISKETTSFRPIPLIFPQEPAEKPWKHGSSIPTKKSSCEKCDFSEFSKNETNSELHRVESENEKSTPKILLSVESHALNSKYFIRWYFYIGRGITVLVN